MSVLNVIYDLELEPIHFGIVPSLVCAEVNRVVLGLEYSRFFIVSASGDGFRRASARDHNISLEEKRWRLEHLVKASIRLVPSCKSVSVFDDRALFQKLLPSLLPNVCPVPTKPGKLGKLGKHAATVSLARENGNDIQLLKAPAYAVNAAREWLSNITAQRPPVSLTLRQSTFHDGRNSNIANWVDFADWLVEEGYQPIFVPDTEAVMSGTVGLPERFIVNEAAALNMELRTALYELCNLNYFVGNGPCLLPQFNKHISYILCNLLVPGHTNSTPEHFERIGVPVGTQMPGQKNKYAKFVWEPDNLDVLKSEFQKWRAKFEVY